MFDGDNNGSELYYLYLRNVLNVKNIKPLLSITAYFQS